MRIKTFGMALLACAGAGAAEVSTSPDRVKTKLDVDFERIGTLAQRTVDEIGDSDWTIGCECLDRDYADFAKYREFLPKLGIRKLRLQGGWAKCEKEKGRYDFRWLDEIVDWANAHGHSCMIQTSYGNPIYKDPASKGAYSTMPHEGEYFEAWKRWVDALSKHFAGRVTDWEMWNEPNNTEGNTPEVIALNDTVTAEIIKRNIPNARIAGIVLGHDDDFPALIKALAATGKAGLFTWITTHPYDLNPEKYVGEHIEANIGLVNRYAPGAKLRVGESGAVSEMVEHFGYKDIPFTEISQAKLALRRMLVDHAYGIDSTVFTIADLNYDGVDAVQRNPKGLLRANAKRDIIAVKRAFYAVQNCVGVFDRSLELAPTGTFTNADETVFFREWRGGDGTPVVAFWKFEDREDDGWESVVRVMRTRPSESFATQPTVFERAGEPLEEPVWVDLLSGRVYALPKECQIVHSCGVTFVDVPVYDSPCLLTERKALRLR